MWLLRRVLLIVSLRVYGGATDGLRLQDSGGIPDVIIYRK